MKEIFVLNIGGTFNKKYNEVTGSLDVPKDNDAIEMILTSAYKNNLNITCEGLIFKDSLDMDDADRKAILTAVSSYSHILIVHGTDTMDKTAAYLAQHIKNQTIVLTGAMQPFSIDCLEATANFAMSMQFLQQSNQEGVFIGMHGLVLPHEQIVKNRIKGVFECQK